MNLISKGKSRYGFIVLESVNSVNPKVRKLWLKCIVTLHIALLSSFYTLAQMPDLGSASEFAMFTSIGALGNTGTSEISGDIGTNNGDITGFEAPTVVYGHIELENAVTAQCAIDVQAAYDELLATTPTVGNHAPTFGSGETLPPGVYAVGEAGSLAGDITLDAAGNPDAIFIFQFTGAFTAGDFSTIILINGATASNVFWIAEGAISMQAQTDMNGTFISNNGAISLGAGSVLEGRMFSTAGAASIIDAFINIPTRLVLPIGLLSFTGHCDGQTVVLDWETATEYNNSYFTIERSLTGASWQIVGTVAGAGNSNSPIEYTLTDMTYHEGPSYYRLKQTDVNGDYNYKATITTDQCEDQGVEYFTICPNPTNGKFELLYNGNTSEINSIDIWNAQGNIIFQSKGFQSTFDLSTHLPGFYFILIEKNSSLTRLKFVLTSNLARL